MGSVEAVCERHERLIHWLVWRQRAKGAFRADEIEDLTQQLRLTVIEVWRRYGRGCPREELDRIVRSSLTFALIVLQKRRRRLLVGEVALSDFHIVAVDGTQEDVVLFNQTYELAYERLSQFGRCVLRELVNPSPGFRRALTSARAGVGRSKCGGGKQALARHFKLSPWLVSMAFREVRMTVIEILDVDPRIFPERYLY